MESVLGLLIQLPISRIAIVAFLTTIPCQLIPGQAQQPPPNQSQLTSKDVTDEEMEKFVAAYEAVEIISADLQEKMAAVQDVESANRLSQEANKAAAVAVRANGLEIPRYNILANAISTDKELLGRFQKMQKEQKERAKKKEKKEKN
jgi:hypothetical protein